MSARLVELERAVAALAARVATLDAEVARLRTTGDAVTRVVPVSAQRQRVLEGLRHYGPINPRTLAERLGLANEHRTISTAAACRWLAAHGFAEGERVGRFVLYRAVARSA